MASPYATTDYSHGTPTAVKKLSGADQYSNSSALYPSIYTNGAGTAPSTYGSYESGHEGDQDLNMEDAKIFVRWLSESVGRVSQLSSQIEIPQHARELLLVMIDVLGKQYVEVALEHAMERLQDKQSEGTVEYLDHTIRVANDIVQLISNTANKLLMELATDSSTVRRDMSQTLMNYVAHIEEKVKVLEDSGVQQQTMRKRWEKITRW
ncbi:exocyst complex component Sec10-domain-containing protein [Lipomyces tetrasporus]|uniref:Exocyst complex component Sec10-domain-containing protein n=1 Tax=Lipomyces tetrasporus TaxID=54092 RepID=A0AAD7QXI3_9ASCO|nr:exocyst complex component Sec10-domain-containing protein [Lipomyces tetrasporus]KAJ8103318.1 exocyst complex component Sec10-domain-containing protein [Lipomyces tetrasporus]